MTATGAGDGTASVQDHLAGFRAEDDVHVAARARGLELGARPISAETGVALRFLVRMLGARAVVEVGTGAGSSGLWLLRGMAPDGVLTSIDVEPELQRAARQAFLDAGHSGSGFRLILGQALHVLPRLTDAAYDLVFVDGAKAEYPHYLEQGVRLLRPGGVIAFDSVLGGGRVADPAQRDPAATALREVALRVRDDDGLMPLLLPLGDGLLLALRVP